MSAVLGAVSLLAGPGQGQAPPVTRLEARIESKDVAAPPSDLLSGRLRLPEPAETARPWSTSLRPVTWTRARDGSFLYEARVPVGAAGEVAFLVLSPGAAQVELEALPSAGAVRSSAPVALTDELDEVAPGVLARVRRGVADAPGPWTVRLRSAAAHEATLLVSDAAPFAILAHVADWTRTSERELPVRAWLAAAGAPSRPARLAVDAFRARASDGVRAATVALADDGLHGDGAAGDGVFGGSLPAGLSGDVTLRVEALARTPEGHAFARTAPLAFPVLERRYLLDGTVSGEVLDGTRLALRLGGYDLEPGRALLVAAEVWGTDELGAAVPVAWLARIQEPDALGRVSLSLDGRWLSRAGASEPLELRAVRVQDPDTSGVLHELDRLLVPSEGLPAVAGEPPGPLTEDMLSGAGVAGLRVETPGDSSRWGPRKRVDDPGVLLLVHGYCSGSPPWPAGDFSEPKLVFQDFDQNRTHDEFARLLLEATANVPSFGVVAHSQGGMAALHLYTYYRSGLDLAQGERRIQSVGSPYQGTPLASLGSFACGVNDDMTPAGAALWLAGIPTWARAQVHTWSTSNAGSVCNFLSSLILSSPNDGVVERSRAVLAGADFRGHVLGWCHTTGMSEPAQYTDASRNAEMDLKAAR